MDLNALSKLTSTPDVKKASVGSAQGDSGFETVYKKAHATEKTPNSDTDETAEVELDNTDAVLAATPEKDKPKGPVRQDASIPVDATQRPDVPTRDDEIAAPETLGVAAAEAEPLNATAAKGPRSAAPEDASATIVPKPQSNTQGAKEGMHPEMEQVGAGSPVAVGDDAPEAQTLSSPKQADAEKRPLDSKETQVSTQQGAVKLPSTNALAAAPAPTPDANIAAAVAVQPPTSEQTVPNLSVQAPIDADMIAVHTPAEKPAVQPAMSLVERHLGGHAVRMPLEQSNVSVSVKDAKRDVGQPLTGTTIPALPTTTVLGAMTVKAAASSGLVNASSITTVRTQTAPLLATDLQKSLVGGDLPEEIVLDMRPSNTPTSSVGTPATPARAELAASVAQQLAGAMRNAADKQVEIALSPAELGRVRMILSPSDIGVSMNILADRPETLELMRRNIDDLARSFAELGYEDISFSFGQNDQMTDDPSQSLLEHDEQTEALTDWVDAAAIPTDSTSRLAMTPDGIDMRL